MSTFFNIILTSMALAAALLLDPVSSGFTDAVDFITRGMTQIAILMLHTMALIGSIVFGWQHLKRFLNSVNRKEKE